MKKIEKICAGFQALDARIVLGITLASLCLGVYIFVIAGSINKPFATDEIYYAGWAYGIANTGAPVYYPGEDDGLQHRLVEPISHPLLHFNLLALMFLVFGVHYWSLRLLGVFLFIGMLFYLRGVVYKRESHPNERLLLTGLLLIFNPLFMQQSMVMAIEAQAFWFPMLVFLWAFHRESTGHARFRYFPYLVTTLMLICLLWFKETNVPVYAFGCTLYLVAIKRFKMIPVYWLMLILAMALFWASWVLYCQITGVDVYSWWNFTVKGKMATGQLVIHHFIAARGWEAAIQRIWASIRVSISWISLPYVILFFIAAVVRIKDIISGKKQIGFIELCLLYALVLFAITKIVRPTNFIKYENPAYLLVAIFISDVFFANFRKHLSAFLAVAMVGIVVGIGLYSVIPDRILSLRSYFPTHVLQGIGITVAVAALFYIRKTALMTSAVAGLVAGIIVLNMNLYVHQSLNDYTTGQSWGNYGEDLVAPTKWLKKHLKNGEGFAAFKDLQFNMRFMEGKTKSPTWEARLFTKDNAKKQQKRRLLNSGRIQYIDLNRYSNDRRGRAFLETNNYRKVKKIGDHIIYERVDCPYCEKRQVNKKESVRSAKRRRPENQRDDISGKSGFSYIFPQVGPAAERNSA